MMFSALRFIPFFHFHPFFLLVSLLLYFSAFVPGAQQPQLHSHPDPEHSSRLDLHRLDRRIGLGALISLAAPGRRPHAVYGGTANRSHRNIFLQHLRKTLPSRCALLQFLRRRPACHVPLTQPVLDACFWAAIPGSRAPRGAVPGSGRSHQGWT